MLVLATCLVGAFIISAIFTDGNIDDDNDGPGGGMMVPVSVPSHQV